MKEHSGVESEARTVLTVERGLQVLRAFRSERAALTNAELVRRTGLSKATVSRLTSTLLQLGFLRHPARVRGFELAGGAVGMGHAFVESSSLLQTVQPLMQNLAECLDVSAALAVADGLDMVYVAFHASHRVATLRLGVGSVLPMGKTAIGRAYLWALPASDRRDLIKRMTQDAGPEGAVLHADIRSSFDELDATGTCCVWGAILPDTYGFAVPVRVGKQGALLGLSCGRAALHPDLKSERKRIAPTLKKAAVDLQTLLRDFDGPP